MKTLRTPIPDRPRGWRAASLFLALCGLLSAADLDLEVIGSLSLPPRGPAQAVAVSGSHAYVAAGGLLVLDISNPANPQRLGGCDTEGQANALALSGAYAYVADGEAGLQVIDVSKPTSMRRVGGFDTSGFAQGIAVSGAHAYVADDPAGLRVIDLSNPASPRRVGGCPILACPPHGAWGMNNTVSDVVLGGHTAFVVSTISWLGVIRRGRTTQAVSTASAHRDGGT